MAYRAVFHWATRDPANTRLVSRLLPVAAVFSNDFCFAWNPITLAPELTALRSSYDAEPVWRGKTEALF